MADFFAQLLYFNKNTIFKIDGFGIHFLNTNMNIKHILKYPILSFYFIIFFPNAIEASTIRLQSLGYTTLITEDRDNEINLYDFGLNPAWIIKDQQRQWLSFSGFCESAWGDFYRDYDAQKLTNVDINCHGLNMLDENQLVFGAVTYASQYKYNVREAVDKQPYVEHPYRITDNTTGDIFFSGPAIHTLYCRNIYHNKLFVAGTVFYQIITGLKKAFLKPRMIFYDLSTSMAVAYQLNSRWEMGLFFDYSHARDFIEYVLPTTDSSFAIYIRNYRGESVFCYTNAARDFYKNFNQYYVSWQTIYHVIPYFQLGVKLSRALRDLAMTENQYAPTDQGTWEAQQYALNIIIRNKLGSLPIYFGLAYDLFFSDDWAKHPDYDEILTEDDFTQHHGGLGFAYKPVTAPIQLVGEIHWSHSDILKQDYISKIVKNGDSKVFEQKIGVEYAFRNLYFLRLGYVRSKSQISETLRWFSEFQSNHTKNKITGGMGIKFDYLEADIHVEYSRTSSVDHSSRHNVNCYFLIKFFNR